MGQMGSQSPFGSSHSENRREIGVSHIRARWIAVRVGSPAVL